MHVFEAGSTVMRVKSGFPHVQCDILLPAVATLLKADPEEYRRIKRSIAGQPVHAINNFARGWLSPA
jgi:hypothetical protein